MCYITHHRRSTRARPGFTLIELMVVMMIIGVLATMLIPAVQAARVAAKVAKTKTLVFSLETALNMFKSEERLGREYPPSQWDVYNADQWPYQGNQSGFVVWGAQTLVWAVVGADRIGTVKFNRNHPGGLRELYRLNGNQPAYERFGPFLNPGDLTLVPPNDPKCVVQISGRVHSKPPVILDTFGMPILYYRPDRNATDANIEDMIPEEHNGPFTRNVNSSAFGDPANGVTIYRNFFKDDRTEGFGGILRPYNYDTFVLLSAGPDQRYGTADDVANFPVGEN